MFQWEYLRHVLVCLSGVPDLWMVPCVQEMWKRVLLQPLASGIDIQTTSVNSTVKPTLKTTCI